MMQPRLKTLITNEINQSLKEKFGYKNLYMGPKIEKIILNMGLGLDGNDSKILSSCMEDMVSITGQKPVLQNLENQLLTLKQEKIQTLV